MAAARERDGMNQRGDEGGRVYDRRPYADYTGYVPVNSPWTLRDPSRWQPLFITPGNGTFLGQQFITPQWGLTQPYSSSNPSRFNALPPVDSNHRRRDSYQAQADEVIAVQVALTDYQKMVAELFDNKISSLGFSALFITLSRGFSLDQFVHYDFLTNLAAFDGGIATWKEKSATTRCARSRPSGICIAARRSADGEAPDEGSSTTCPEASGDHT